MNSDYVNCGNSGAANCSAVAPRAPAWLKYFDRGRYALSIMCSITALTVSAVIHYQHNYDLVSYALFAGVCRHILDVMGYICSRFLPPRPTNRDVKLFTGLTTLFSLGATGLGSVVLVIQRHDFALYAFISSTVSVVLLSMAILCRYLTHWGASPVAAAPPVTVDPANCLTQDSMYAQDMMNMRSPENAFQPVGYSISGSPVLGSLGQPELRIETLVRPPITSALFAVADPKMYMPGRRDPIAKKVGVHQSYADLGYSRRGSIASDTVSLDNAFASNSEDDDSSSDGGY
jgi:hypothetical protein